MTSTSVTPEVAAEAASANFTSNALPLTVWPSRFSASTEDAKLMQDLHPLALIRLTRVLSRVMYAILSSLNQYLVNSLAPRGVAALASVGRGTGEALGGDELGLGLALGSGGSAVGAGSGSPLQPASKAAAVSASTAAGPDLMQAR